tara:strand:+ start:192 stop:395 length:204 start_codon:yes stop_codon:yes gene_type:complete
MKVGDLVKPARFGIYHMPNSGVGIVSQKKKYSGIKDPLYQVYWSDIRFDNKRWIHPSDLREVVNESR